MICPKLLVTWKVHCMTYTHTHTHTHTHTQTAHDQTLLLTLCKHCIPGQVLFTLCLSCSVTKCGLVLGIGNHEVSGMLFPLSGSMIGFTGCQPASVTTCTCTLCTYMYNPPVWAFCLNIWTRLSLVQGKCHLYMTQCNGLCCISLLYETVRNIL